MTTATDSGEGISLHLTTTPKRKRIVDPALASIGTDRPLTDLLPGQIKEKRGRGRPRTFSDSDVFKLIPIAIAEHGHHALTLAHVAEKIGATPQALIRRFGSRDGMIRAYLKWNSEITRARTEAVRTTHGSPLAHLYARVIDDLDHRGDEIASGSAHINMVAFWAAARADEESRQLLRMRQDFILNAAADFLEEAKAAGELIEHDSQRLAHLMVMAINGTILRQTHSPDSSLGQALRNILDDVFAPYRTRAS